jgi:hypothetical protein
MIYFLLLLALFLGAVGFGYVQADNAGKLRTELAAQRDDGKAKANKLLLMEHYIADIGEVVGMPGKYSGKAGVDYGTANLDGITGVMSPTDLKSRFTSLGASVEVGASRGLEDLAGQITAKHNSLKKRITEIETERDMVLTQKNEADVKIAEASTQHAKDAASWKTQMDQARADYASGTAGLNSQITALQANVSSVGTQLNEEKERAAAERKVLKNDVAKLQMHNTALVDKDRKRQPPSVADGSVIAAKAGVPTAFIDLGRKDMLVRGTIFQVKGKNEQGVKGYARVTRVEQDRSEVALYDVVNPVADPIRGGDQLYNDLYSPGDKRHIFLLGRFDYPNHKPQLEQLLKDLGNEVVGKMGPGVDTVILGDDAINEAGDGFASLMESPDFKNANFLGVEFVPLRKLRDVIRPQ